MWVRHKVLVEGRSQRQVAKEMGISRVTVRKYVEEAVPLRKETGARARPVWEKVGPRVDVLLEDAKACQRSSKSAQYWTDLGGPVASLA